MSDTRAQITRLCERMDKAALFMREIDNRLRIVEQTLGDHLREHKARAEMEAEASKPPTPRAPRVKRTPGGKIKDPLLADLCGQRKDLNLSVRQLANVLGYPRNTVSNWLNRTRAPGHPEDRVRIQEWIDLSNNAPARLLREWREEL
ncbi:MAG: helix-turn-helix transcriptional regulator [bacterium]|nr:helix-turn-helix transcriptional regulator [bacterium]